ncbi:MAG: TatD family hydrolase [Lachnospiraceae bacterium]|nr:TatD family hydrolase [Lachnospiraceae bacterium]
MIFDTHAHYDDGQFDGDRTELLATMEQDGVGRIVNIGSNRDSWEKVVELTADYPFVYGSIGIHPSVIKELTEEVFETMQEFLQKEKIIAVGEIGLDYYWDKDENNHKLQKEMLVRQIGLARAYSLPIVVHSREAAADTYGIMKEYAHDLPGIIHCYSYSVEQARAYVKMGYYIGVGGVVTFPNAKKLKEVVAEIPLSSIVMETDAPYLSPIPNRGKRNTSANLKYVAKAIAELKGVSFEKVLAVTWENGNKVYNLGE